MIHQGSLGQDYPEITQLEMSIRMKAFDFQVKLGMCGQGNNPDMKLLWATQKETGRIRGVCYSQLDVASCVVGEIERISGVVDEISARIQTTLDTCP